MTKVHAPIIRAIAHTLLYREHYFGEDGEVTFDHLTEHGIDAYVDWRTDAGNGMRYLIGIDRSKCGDAGRKIVAEHVDAFNKALSESMGEAKDFCRMVVDCDDVALRYWCDKMFAPALASVREAKPE